MNQENLEIFQSDAELVEEVEFWKEILQTLSAKLVANESPNGASAYQPGATPREHGTPGKGAVCRTAANRVAGELSHCRGICGGPSARVMIFFCWSRGVAPGWYATAPLGLNAEEVETSRSVRRRCAAHMNHGARNRGLKPTATRGAVATRRFSSATKTSGCPA